MGFEDFYRISAHAVITDDENKVLLIKATYANKPWGLPGGTLDKGETIHQGLYRECLEELGQSVRIEYLSGIYYHSHFNSHAVIFRCQFIENKPIVLSEEHSEYAYFSIDELNPTQKQRVLDCLNFDGEIKSAVF